MLLEVTVATQPTSPIETKALAAEQSVSIAKGGTHLSRPHWRAVEVMLSGPYWTVYVLCGGSLVASRFASEVDARSFAVLARGQLGLPVASF